MALDQMGDAEDEVEMSFLDHLEHLRWHLIRSLIAIAVISIAFLIFPEILFQKVLFAPTKTDFWTFQILGPSKIPGTCPHLFKTEKYVSLPVLKPTPNAP